MGHYIIKLNDETTNADYYLIWSSVVDSPITYGMSLSEFEEYYKFEYGNQAFENNYNRRMQMVEKKGTSALLYDNVDELIRTNRSGTDGETLQKEELIKKYCTHIDYER